MKFQLDYKYIKELDREALEDSVDVARLLNLRVQSEHAHQAENVKYLPFEL